MLVACIIASLLVAEVQRRIAPSTKVAALEDADLDEISQRSTHDIPRSTRRREKEKDEQQEYLACFPDLTKAAEQATEAERRRMVQDKELYWKLQNEEDHAGQSSLTYGTFHLLIIVTLQTLHRKQEHGSLHCSTRRLPKLVSTHRTHSFPSCPTTAPIYVHSSPNPTTLRQDDMRVTCNGGKLAVRERCSPQKHLRGNG